MAERRKIKSGEEEYDVLELEYEVVQNEPSILSTEDGTTIKVHYIPMRVFKVLDDDGNVMYTEQGEPRVIIRYDSNVSAIESED